MRKGESNEEMSEAGSERGRNGQGYPKAGRDRKMAGAKTETTVVR